MPYKAILMATSTEVAVVGTGRPPPITRPGRDLGSRARGDPNDNPQNGQVAAFRSTKALQWGHMRCVGALGEESSAPRANTAFSRCNLNQSFGGISIKLKYAGTYWKCKGMRRK